jgi:hypothetical protein
VLLRVDNLENFFCKFIYLFILVGCCVHCCCGVLSVVFQGRALWACCLYWGSCTHLKHVLCTRHVSAKEEAGSSHGLWDVDQFDGAGESKSRSGRSQREELVRGSSSGQFLKVLGMHPSYNCQNIGLFLFSFSSYANI